MRVAEVGLVAVAALVAEAAAAAVVKPPGWAAQELRRSSLALHPEAADKAVAAAVAGSTVWCTAQPSRHGD